MIVVVTGSRDWTDREFIFDKLDELHGEDGQIEAIVEGEAPGADLIAKQWGKMHGLPVLGIEAEWEYYGRGAGSLRNGWLVKYGHPDICLAFPLPQSRGTWNMVGQCQAAGVETVIHDISNVVQEVSPTA